jgi:predicted transcriptional regulator of viral defense system
VWSDAKMQPIKILTHWLQENANSEHYLFTLQDLRGLFPDLSHGALKTLLSRAVRAGYLERVCHSLYAYKKVIPSHGLLLFHAAARLRGREFNYISLETVLSDAGVISQVPMNWISIMSSGRSNKIACGKFGTIEFIHTNKKPAQVVDQLTYNAQRKLWQASVRLAISDMKATHRNCDLIDWDVAHEFI